MAGEHRTTIDTVAQPLDELHERIRAFDFVAAVRLLENAHPDKPRVGDAVRVRDDIVRLSQHVTLGFRGQALQSLEAGKRAHPHRLHVNFLGLLGSHGPMPLHLTEYSEQRAKHHADPTFREFLDLFNHRMLSLFYKASVQFDPAVSFDRAGDNTYAEVLGALCGLLPEASQARDTIPDAVKRHYPAWFGSSAKSPDGIAALLNAHFDLPVTVREWVAGWLPLPEDSRIRLGQRSESAQLGHAVHIGKRVWSIRHKFCVQLGPLDWETFSSFKPGGEQARILHDLVRNYVGDEWDWDLELKLSSPAVRPLTLDRKRTLGFDSWVSNGRGKRLPDQTVALNQKLIGPLAQKRTLRDDAVSAHR